MTPLIPYIDEAKLKSEADQIFPVVEQVTKLIPVVGQEANTVLTLLGTLADDDSIRVPVVQLINQLSGAKAPG